MSGMNASPTESAIAPGWYVLRLGDYAVRIWRRGRKWDVMGMAPSGEIIAGPVRVSTLRRSRIIAAKWLARRPTNGS